MGGAGCQGVQNIVGFMAECHGHLDPIVVSRVCFCLPCSLLHPHLLLNCAHSDLSTRSKSVYLYLAIVVLFAVPPTGPQHVPYSFSSPCFVDIIDATHLAPDLCFHISHVQFFLLSLLGKVFSLFPGCFKNSGFFSLHLSFLYLWLSHLYYFLSIDKYFF